MNTVNSIYYNILHNIQMKFGKKLIAGAIPEWRQCYLNYDHLKMFINVIKTIVTILNAIKELKLDDEGVEDTVNLMNSQNIEQKKQTLARYYDQLLSYANQANYLFYEAFSKQILINNRFFHMKLIELNLKLKNCQQLHQICLTEEHIIQDIRMIIEFLYVEASYLRKMKDQNIEGGRKILKKHQKYAQGYLKTPDSTDKDSIRLLVQLKRYIDKVQNYYVQLSKGPSKNNRNYIRQISKKVQVKHSQSCFFGGWVGICVTVVVMLIIILELSEISIEKDPVFSRDFPTWRGIAYFIFYMWIISINTYFFEAYNVSHRIIFHYNEHHYSTSAQISVLAGVFSTIFLVMFTIYTLSIQDILDVSSSVTPYLVLVVWGSFVLFWINPLPILWRTRFYAFKLILISILSPFLGVPFEVVWMTDQVVSLVTPLKDFAYTICYYTQLDLNAETDPTDNYCSSVTRIEIVFVVGAIAYSYRMIQCIRQGYDKKKYFFTPQFFNTLKYASSLITTVLSYSYKAEDETLFNAWLAFAIISTVYSFVWDLKMDWYLLQMNAEHKFLRKKLTYTPYQIYYIIMLVNLVFRLVWISTLSPAITEEFFGSPQIFSLVTGAIEIFRRGIWNLLRVEREHLENCKNFQAMPETPCKVQQMFLKKVEEVKNQELYTEQSFSSTVEKMQENGRIQKIMFIRQRGALVKTEFLSLVKQSISNEEVSMRIRKDRAANIKKKVKKIKEKIEKLIGEKITKDDQSDNE